MLPFHDQAFKFQIRWSLIYRHTHQTTSDQNVMFMWNDQLVARQTGKTIPMFCDVYHSASRMPTSGCDVTWLDTDNLFPHRFCSYNRFDEFIHCSWFIIHDSVTRCSTCPLCSYPSEVNLYVCQLLSVNPIELNLICLRLRLKIKIQIVNQFNQFGLTGGNISQLLNSQES